VNSKIASVRPFLMPSTSDERPTVFYRADKPHMFQVGKAAYVFPINHPQVTRVTGNGETPARTSPVQAVNILTGEFWTRNTHYAPLMP
jgi:hypothetical protein